MRRYLLLISALILGFDRLTKWLVIEKIPLYHEINIIPGLFRLTHLENTGAAFSLFADTPGPWPNRILLGFSLVATCVIAFFIWKSGDQINPLTTALALFLGGTLGNLWDRLAYGRVIDFLDFYIGQHHWPPFNVADSAIVIAALLLAGEIFFAPSRKGRAA